MIDILSPLNEDHLEYLVDQPDIEDVEEYKRGWYDALAGIKHQMGKHEDYSRGYGMAAQWEAILDEVTSVWDREYSTTSN